MPFLATRENEALTKLSAAMHYVLAPLKLLQEVRRYGDILLLAVRLATVCVEARTAGLTTWVLFRQSWWDFRTFPESTFRSVDKQALASRGNF